MAETTYDPNLKDENRSWEILLTGSLLLPLAVLATCLRMYLRMGPSYRFGVDDVLIMLSTAFSIVGVASEFNAISYGFGRHAQFLSKSQVMHAHKWQAISEEITNVTTWILKTSICFFILRLVKGTHRKFVYSIWGILVLLFLANVTTIIAWWFQSRPIHGLWDPSVKATRMSTTVAVDIAYASNGINAFTDIFCAVTPIYFLWNVQINRNRKIGLWILTGLGLLTSIGGILRIAFLDELADFEDLTWAPLRVFIASMCERLGGGIIANLPTLKPLFSKVVELSTRRGPRTTTSYGTTRDGFGRLPDTHPSLSRAHHHHRPLEGEEDDGREGDVLLRSLHGRVHLPSPALVKGGDVEVGGWSASSGEESRGRAL